METGTSAPADRTPTLSIEITPEEAVLLLTDMPLPTLTTTDTYDKLHEVLREFSRRYA